jgi:hypothetical protein
VHVVEVMLETPIPEVISVHIAHDATVRQCTTATLASFHDHLPIGGARDAQP